MKKSASYPDRFGRNPWLAWALCGMIGLFSLINLGLYLSDRRVSDSIIELAGDVVWSTIPIVFAVVAALIISKQPRNTIGWLLMTPAIAFVVIPPVDNYLGSFTTSPVLTLSLWLMTWFQSWSWLLFILPLLLTLLLFPTGKPPSPRWRWVPVWALCMVVFLAIMGLFPEKLQPTNATWTLPNPIGLLPDALESYIVLPWIVGLSLLALTCAVSLFVRYRHAPAVEREQIKWLLYAGGVFIVLYVPLLGWQGAPEGLVGDVAMLLVYLSMPLIPISIAIAILRYRLWDIDVLIRRTLVYGGLTATLALVYFGSVVLLQEVFQAITGQHQSPIVTVISTLAIVVLFTPLRRRIQDGIDRRFYRRKYNAEMTLAAFSASLRDEVDLDALGEHLVAVVQETMQPESVSLWIKPSPPVPFSRWGKGIGGKE